MRGAMPGNVAVPRCQACAREVSADSRFCPSCGTALDGSAATGPYQPSTIAVAAPRPPEAYADAVEPARFEPGQLLSGRYRIVALLGTGGMGQVYRADDLTLGQSIALKFLPEHLSHEPQRLLQLRHEVRVARQVSHPN